MSRFNPKIVVPIEKVRVCLFVDPDIYRRIKALCSEDGTNVSRWFDATAKRAISERVLGFTESPKRRTK